MNYKTNLSSLTFAVFLLMFQPVKNVTFCKVNNLDKSHQSVTSKDQEEDNNNDDDFIQDPDDLLEEDYWDDDLIANLFDSYEEDENLEVLEENQENILEEVAKNVVDKQAVDVKNPTTSTQPTNNIVDDGRSWWEKKICADVEAERLKKTAK